jgi:hypothetical protein
MNQPYSPYCLCHSCADHAFWSSLSAMTDKQIVERAKGRVMTEEQEKLIESVKVRVWNSCMKGDVL